MGHHTRKQIVPGNVGVPVKTSSKKYRKIDIIYLRMHIKYVWDKREFVNLGKLPNVVLVQYATKAATTHATSFSHLSYNTL